MILRLALLTVALMLAAAAPAGAAYPNERPAGPKYEALATFGLDYWQNRDVTGCPSGVRMILADSLYDSWDGVDAVERGGGCHAWFSAPWLASMAHMGDNRANRRVALKQRCEIGLHGVGHALGLTHDDADRYPVMTPGAAPVKECRQYALQMVPVPRRSVSRAARGPHWGVAAGHLK
jgi:hypothetical protein